MYVIAMYVKEDVKMVKRYGVVSAWAGHAVAPVKDGHYVTYDDYAALQAECERLRGVGVVDGWIVADPDVAPTALYDCKWNDGSIDDCCPPGYGAEYWAQLCCKEDSVYVTHWRPSKVEE